MAIPKQANLVLDLDMENLVDFKGNTVTNSGTTTTNDQLNRINKARDFAGSTEHFSLGSGSSILNSTSGTICLWIKYDSFSSTNFASNPIFDVNRTSGEDRFYLVYDSRTTDQIFFGYGNSAVGYLTTLTAGTWYFISVTWTSSTQKIYVNAIEEASGSTAFSGDLSGDFSFGEYHNLSEYSDCAMANIKAWDTVLTAQEIQQVYADTAPNYNDLFTDCVLYLDMNGDAKDVTNNNNDGTVSGASLTTDHLGNTNRAYEFAAGAESITLPSSGITDDMITSNTFTMFAWIYPTTIAGDDRFIYYLIENSVYSLYVKSTGELEGWIRQSNLSNIYSTSTATLSLNTWYFVAFTSDGTNMITYIDGAQDGTNTFDGTTQDVSVGNIIGNNTGDTADWIGKIGLTGLWSRALSAGEIKLLYDLTKTKYIYPYPRVTGE